jgi:zinc transport system substrate-binding protein
VLRIVLILVALAVLAGCSSSDRDESKTQVVAAFYPVAFAAEQIGGPGVQVTDLVPAGVEPHDYELTPNDVKAIQDADVILYLGGGFQPALESALRSAPGRKIDLLDGLPVVKYDPHAWLDPELYADMATEIGDALGEPETATLFAERLDELNAEYAAGLQHCERRNLVTSHAAFGYLARAYKLRQSPLPGGSAEALAKSLGTFALTHASMGDTTVFTEPLLPRDVAEVVARTGGFQLATLDPIESAEEGQDYFSLMRANLVALRKGLGCR